jgi:H+/gluconate symporter-like permease
VVSTGTPFETTTAPRANVCAKEKRETAIVGGTITGVCSILIVGLAATIYWMHKREKRQRRLKEHYEEQFSQTNAYRKALASSAGSCRGSILLDDLKLKSSSSE